MNSYHLKNNKKKKKKRTESEDKNICFPALHSKLIEKTVYGTHCKEKSINMNISVHI